MEILKPGSTGPKIELLQLALSRAGKYSGIFSGVFDEKTRRALISFQESSGLRPDGIAGSWTQRSLFPYYTGFVAHTVRPGDTLYRLMMRYGTSLRAMETANPGLDPTRVPIGSDVIVPLPFDVVPTSIAYTSELISLCCRGLAARYPFIRLGEMGKSVMGRPLYTLTLGTGERRVFYNASHHANEWITTPLLLKYCEQLSKAFMLGTEVYGFDAAKLLGDVTICIAPAVDPDGIDLVTGALTSGAYFRRALTIASDYSEIPFPSGWKANILGTDLNLQYPAGWDEAREIKYAQGFISPAPRDFVGSASLSAQEARAVYDFTPGFDPSLTLSYHSQGNTIYWKYLDFEPPRSREIAMALGRASGYFVEETPYSSGFAGYKDWFIQNYNRPGYTIEVGSGQNPLPLSQFDSIYEANLGILTLAAVLAPSPVI